MLNKAKDKFAKTSIKFLEMDAQQMNFMDEQFDIVVGSLILSVVPNANKCFDEMVRVLKKTGKLLFSISFLLKEKSPHYSKTIRPVIKVLGTDIGLNFEELFETQKTKLRIKEDAPIMFNGLYRKIVITK